MRVAPVTTSQHAFSQTAPQDDPHRTDGHQWDTTAWTMSVCAGSPSRLLISTVAYLDFGGGDV